MCPTLDDRGHDVLLEFCAAGADQAASALSRMTGLPITVRVPEVVMTGVGQIPELVDSAVNEPHAGIFLRIHGEAGGSIGLILDRESAFGLLALLGVGVESSALAVLAREEVADPLKEMGNILSSSYLTAISRLANRMLVPSVPTMTVDIPERIIERAVTAEAGVLAEGALVVKTLFEVPREEIAGTVFLVPDESFLEAILNGVS